MNPSPIEVSREEHEAYARRGPVFAQFAAFLEADGQIEIKEEA